MMAIYNNNHQWIIIYEVIYEHNLFLYLVRSLFLLSNILAFSIEVLDTFIYS